MANNKKKTNNKTRVVILVFVEIIAFVVSVGMNVVGMKSAINKEPDSSGMAGFSVRTKKAESLGSNVESKIDKDGKVVEESILVNAVPIVKLNNNDWDRINSNFSNFQLDEDGNATFEEGYKLYCNGRYVNYVVFEKTYKKEILGHLKVGADFKTIEEKLGTPTFRNKSYLAYKTKEVYVFFYRERIVVYSNKNMSNKNLEKLLNSYSEKSYEKGRTHFLVDIRNDYPDFIIDINEETDVVTMKSVVRQIVAKLDALGNIEVELYNGYKVATEETKDLVNKNRYKTNEDDFVEIFENERISGK